MRIDPERVRLAQAARQEKPWRQFGPYLSDRQWGTVREDYSAGGDAWGSFPHEHARSRAYRWGEDGLLGICDDQGFLCFALALWNERDPILKERLYGLANPEGNHGEDVKECYYYLDATPTASYLKALYKYPQAAFPYDALLSANRGRSKQEPEFELLDTGIFDQGRYFDVFVEYAKADADDVLVRITAHNRGPDPAPLHLLPTLWFRNTWSWKGGSEADIRRPSVRVMGRETVAGEHERLGKLHLTAAAGKGMDPHRWLFTENETNNARLWGGHNEHPQAKDGFHALVVERREGSVHPEVGTKCAAYFHGTLPAGGSAEVRLRLSREPSRAPAMGEGFDEVFAARKREADIFYSGMALSQDAATLRQACAGLIWSKQFYDYDVRQWLTGDPLFPPPPEHRRGRNARWGHLSAADVISMPDKWEFPWFAAWDLAFHALPFTLIDPEFARQQLALMLNERYQSPSGQLAAYEYDFGDVNPPVHAWACRKCFTWAADEAPDVDFLKRVFPKLLMNFTWWLNRKDPDGDNLFSGGFLGLDNIGVFDRSMKLPGGVRLEQSDATAWMAFFCNEMLAISLDLARADPTYEEMATTFLLHFASISEALNADDGLWDDQAGFYYDELRADDHRKMKLKVRSLVGLLPMVGTVLVRGDPSLQRVRGRLQQIAQRRPGLRAQIEGPREVVDPKTRKPMPTWLLSLVPRRRLERLLSAMFDEREFLSPHGIRSLSRVHLDQPLVADLAGQRFEVRYLPGESDSWMFGGNSNWRGPVWMPLNALFVEALANYGQFYGEDLLVELPTGSGRRVNLLRAARELTERLLGLFRPDPSGRRPCHGAELRYANDPNWKDLILFNEYFHGDSGRGCGASHQTGWTAMAAVLAALLARADHG
jgi:hypothetical protein